MRRHSLAFVLVAVMVAALLVPADAQSPERIEIHPFQSVTLTTTQILTGDTNGPSITLAGELRIPKLFGTDRLPAVIFVEGSGGISMNTDAWARDMNSIGIAAFIVDSFTGRGIVPLNDQQLDPLATMVDAFRALAVLAKHPRIDPQRIAVMGFSRGAVAALYSSTNRFRNLYGPPDFKFAAHIGLYAVCNVQYRDDDKVTGAPIRLFHGITDDITSIVACRNYVIRLKSAGADIRLTEYPNTDHAYDLAILSPPLQLERAESTRNCLLKEGDNGQILNIQTDAVFTSHDSCLERGTHVGFNYASYEATRVAVREFLIATFKIGN